MKRTPVALLCLSVLTLSGCDDLSATFDDKEVKTVRQAMAIAEPGDVTVKSWDDLLSHRAICENTRWSYEAYGNSGGETMDEMSDAHAVVYRCDFKDYDTQVLKAYSQYLLNTSTLQQEINDLKIELDEIDRQEKQMDGLKTAMYEMSSNGLASLYSLLADALGVGYVDYEALLNGQHVMKKLTEQEQEQEYNLNPTLHESYLTLFSNKLDEVKSILEHNGIDAKSVQALGLYRSKIENSDYLRMSREERDAYIEFDINLFKERRESIIADIEYRQRAQKEKENATPPVIKSLKQMVVFDFTPGAVKPIYCGITYTLNGEESAYTRDDDFAACLRMSTAQTWNDDFTPLFTGLLPK